MKSQDIRNAFIEFFKDKDHRFVSGNSIVPDNDPSLLFINAGMNQFKDVFLGAGNRDYSRAVNSQICIRVSGKHNDLEDVGRDSTHLTSFEMLGNWSFGDYYKKDAIKWAWKFFTEVLNIPKQRLVATVFEEDKEALELWKTETDIDFMHIVKCDKVDNFWEMGATGPCGPCSEIHVFTKDKPIDVSLNQEILNSDQFIELWNLVFIQYNRRESGKLELLPQKHVDTGAGLERVVAFMQNTSSVYQTDLMKPIIKKIEVLTGVEYSESEDGMAHRVLADHIRTLCFGIADNVIPSNEGRGYVLRRLLRRACRYAKKLGINNPILYKLVQSVIECIGDHFEHLRDRQIYIETVVKAEEDSFLQTLDAGLILFEKIADGLTGTVFSGDDAFKLYDTYGFPIDLTEVIASERGFEIDIDRFNICLNEQRQRSRNATKFEDMKAQSVKIISKEIFSDLKLNLSEDLNVAKGGEAKIVSDPKEKFKMAQHHSVTHLLHESLRRHLGKHVHQSGSLVDIDRLRFDFTHFQKISDLQLKDIELQVNTWIQDGLPIRISFSTLDEAKASGVMALFGEKYDESRVRVVNIGGESVELCAGTHVQNSSQIQYFKIVSESAISAGNRRIEAIAGSELVEAYFENKISWISQKIKDQLDECLRLNKEHRIDKLLQDECLHLQQQLNLFSGKEIPIKEKDNVMNNLMLLNENTKVLVKKIKKSISKKMQESCTLQISDLKNQIVVNQNSKFKYIIKQIEVSNVGELRNIADKLAALDSNIIVILGFCVTGNCNLVIKCSTGVSEKEFHAGNVIKSISSQFGGGGGGRQNMAQAGGIAEKNLKDVFDFCENKIKALS